MTSPWWWWEKALDGWLGRGAGEVAAAAALVVIGVGTLDHSVTDWFLQSYINWQSHEPFGRLRVAEHFTVGDGVIRRIRHVHDTAALLGVA